MVIEAAEPLVLRMQRGSAAQGRLVSAKTLVLVDPVSKSMLDFIGKVAPSEAPVLISGDTGTGKELVAQRIHHLSGRAGPFLAVNCGAISEHLAESELFGHEAGAFTGAVGRREGWFEAASGGTLFLDEIGDLALPMQVKLLRVLQEQQVVRVGSRKHIPVDVRLIAATNVNLDRAAAAGRFRSDLLYRLNIARVHLPPLCERRGDIVPLAENFLRSYSLRMHKEIPTLSSGAVEALLRHSWPGNIRELENVMHLAVLMSNAPELRPEDLNLAEIKPNEVFPPSGRTEEIRHGSLDDMRAPPNAIASHLRRWFSSPGEALYGELERLIVTEAYQHCGRNQVQSAELLGVSRNVLRTLLRRHGQLPTSSERQASSVPAAPEITAPARAWVMEAARA
jgi:DNA-binding NtrC family response regulator